GLVLRRISGPIEPMAPRAVSVMGVSESGTGKKVVARALHKWSGRVNKPLIAIDCAAMREKVLESEMFGYVKGAFTGASADGKT
ncbi:sigma 54-interacting transcriptional regulator, partial [Escherichia coli]|uniref:sigma 54-interacting transcriptional regulator n=1 Tax=Escherichia coli TaxID=562 RepID=UPI0013F9DBF3